MRGTGCAVLMALAVCGPAWAGDLGIPIDIFADEFNLHATAANDAVVGSEPVCANRTSCFSDLGAAGVLLTSAGPDDDLVVKVVVVSPPGDGGNGGFNTACDALMALLSADLPADERKAVVAGLLRDALHRGEAKASPRGRARYGLVLRADKRLIFTAMP